MFSSDGQGPGASPALGRAERRTSARPLAGASLPPAHLCIQHSTQYAHRVSGKAQVPGKLAECEKSVGENPKLPKLSHN